MGRDVFDQKQEELKLALHYEQNNLLTLKFQTYPNHLNLKFLMMNRLTR